MSQTTTSNTTYVVGPTTYLIDCKNDVINVDSTDGTVIIVLPNIVDNGLTSIPKPFFINDTGGSAATNNITIVPTGDNTVNSGASVVLAVNGESAVCSPCSNVEWFIKSSANTAADAITGSGAAKQVAFFNDVQTITGTGDFTWLDDDKELLIKDGINKIFRVSGATSSVSLGDYTGATSIIIDYGSGSIVIKSTLLNIKTLPAYADDAAAGSAGLITGDIYQTSGAGLAPLNVAGILMVKQ